MIRILKKIIDTEDKKNPFTDEKLAQMMSLSRVKVVHLRLMAGIPNSRERRKNIILSGCAKIILSDAKSEISDRQFTGLLNQQGYNISRYTAVELRKQIELEAAQGKWQEMVPVNSELDPIEITESKQVSKETVAEDIAFSNIIGYKKGIKTQINQAKAAILYPPHGLNTLLTGPSGVGKSYLAENMYRFAIKEGVLEDKAPFVVFNCADYADNPQLLLAQLFGYVKGAFSGAVTSKTGLVEKANQGILFLDEVHRLPSEGQEILFSILDKGEFRRLGETCATKITIRIIAATTENLESTLLLTFRRRIPMVIDIPSLSERPISERFSIIKKFFKQEALQIQRTIKVNSEVMKFLLVYECRGNIGQLLSDIRVACANGFLSCISAGTDGILISPDTLLNYHRVDLLQKNRTYGEITQYASSDIVFDMNPLNETIEENMEISFEKIYTIIEKSFLELRNSKISEKEVNLIVQNRLNLEIKKYLEGKENLNTAMLELESIIDSHMIQAVKQAVCIAKRYIPLLEDRIYYFVSIHLSTLCDHIKSGIYKTAAVDLINIKEHYKKEYAVAKLMMLEIENELKLTFPKEEVAMLTMYLKTFSQGNIDPTGKVKVLVLTHGRVASGMAEVVNHLLNVNDAVGIEMGLDEHPDNVLERTIKIVKEIDEGKGCLLLVDMGSLTKFGEVITKQTGIQTCSIGRVDTVMVLEAVRRAALMDMKLETIVEALSLDPYYINKIGSAGSIDKTKQKAIILSCITGEGNAKKMKDYIQDAIAGIEETVELFTVGVLQAPKMAESIEAIMQQYNVIAVVGTMNPFIKAVPFISVEKVLSGEGIYQIKSAIGINAQQRVVFTDVIHEELIVCKLDLADKIQVIDYMSQMLENYGAVTKEFVLSAYKRESIGATYLNGGIGIPHGDGSYVTKSAMAVASLVQPITWENDFMVDLVFLFALTENDQQYINYFYQIISNKEAVLGLKSANSIQGMQQILSGKQF
ncbi:sigma 54-interacting transcriptional regulator [Propionispira raffinosivorans]|uniref:sigma 54-interacting transcriptional regulator n=1 Tax=Propionispira raffinosivorans TaxID=86959 RepID=UPI00038102D3|nr:sigma 54-interacting transcriptional regulator [Propionispira raffinosivorans]